MTILIISGVVLLILSIVAFYASETTEFEMLCYMSGVTSLIAGIIVWMVVACLCFGWVSSSYKADIINREYKTDYTREEIFYASDVINEIRNLDRKRMEINGDLFKDGNK